MIAPKIIDDKARKVISYERHRETNNNEYLIPL